MDRQFQITLPGDVAYIIHQIEQAGFEAFAVGGCIRDSILGRQPNDWDITTSALPQQVKAIFKKTIDTGIAHGTVTVMRNHIGYEVTTYRIDGEYEDSRHPKEVSFTAKLEEDLKRRDFTINAMAYNERAGLVDIFGGIADLEQKIIRAVGDPKERFTEDALRMMRAVRFAAQLGYRIEDKTAQAVSYLAPNLRNISAERIQVELVKLVTSKHPAYMRLLYETGISQVIMPEFDRVMETAQHNPHHCYSVGEHTLKAMQAVAADSEKDLKKLRLAMLFHDFGKPLCLTTDADGIDHFHGHAKQSEKIADTILHRLKFDNDTIDTVKKLVANHDVLIEPGEKYVRRALSRIGEDIFPLLLKVKQADLDAQSDYKRSEKQTRLFEVTALYEQIIQKGQCVSLQKLAVTGKDLIENGVKQGPEIGTILHEMLALVIDDPACNTREYLLAYLKER